MSDALIEKAETQAASDLRSSDNETVSELSWMLRREEKLDELDGTIVLLTRALAHATAAVYDLRHSDDGRRSGRSPGTRLRIALLALKRVAHGGRKTAQCLYY